MFSRLIRFKLNPFALVPTFDLISNDFASVVNYLKKTIISFIFPKFDLLEKLLIEAKKNNQGFALTKLNSIEGNIGVINASVTNDHVKLKKIFKELDKEKNSRLGFEIFNKISDSHILLASNDANTLTQRKKLLKYMKPKVFVQTIQQMMTVYLKENKTLDLDSHLKNLPHLVRSILAKVILGIEELPPEIDQVLDAVTAECSKHLGSSMFSLSVFLPFNYEYQKIKSDYIRCVKKILSQQTKQILQSLHHYSKEHSNFFIDTIIDLIQQKNKLFSEADLIIYLKTLTENELQNYLSDPSISGIFFVLIGAENLIKALDGCLNAIYNLKYKYNSIFLQKLIDQLNSEGIFKENGEINLSLLQKDTTQNSFLDSLYKESLRGYTTTTAVRYNEHDKQIEDFHIPKNTMLFFQLADDQFDSNQWFHPTYFLPDRFNSCDNNKILHQYPFMPFLVGDRKCPAANISGYFIKTMIVMLLDSRKPFALGKELNEIDPSRIKSENKENIFSVR